MPAMVLAMAGGVRVYREELRRAETAFSRAALVEVQQQRDTLVAASSALAALASNPMLRDTTAAGCDAALSAFERSHQEYSLALLIDASGRVRCSSDPTAKRLSFPADPALAAVIAGGAISVHAVASGAITGQRVMVVLGALPPMEGVEPMALTLSVPETSLEALGSWQYRGVDHSTQNAVVSREGDVVLAGDGGAAMNWLPELPLSELTRGGGVQTFAAASRDGRDFAFVAAPLGVGDAWLIAGMPTEQLYADIAMRAAVPIAAPLLMLLIAIAVGYASIDRLVVRHLIYLARLTRAYGRGRLSLRPRGTDTASEEIAVLGEALGDMAGSLEARQEELKLSARSNHLLLMEVFHRVRNNLQLISSIINMQIRRAGTAEERAALTRVRRRIHVLALVHEHIYQTDMIERVRVDKLLADISTTLAATGFGSKIAGTVTICDLAPVEVSAERATPLALLTSELLTTALRHGPAGAATTLAIDAPSDGNFAIVITSHLKEDALVKPLRSRILLDALAQQMGGKIHVHESAGVREVRILASWDVEDVAEAAE